MASFKNKTIAFANQKGGVGKTTLCTLFANYLYDLHIPVCVIDADLQRTISHIRNQNLKTRNLTDNDITWSVQPLDITKPKGLGFNEFINAINQMMDSAESLPGCVVFDMPGNLGEEGLTPIFSRVDYILCPYFYDQATLSSTGVFIQVMNRMMKDFENMKAKLLFIPNNVRKGVGRFEDLRTWEEIDKIFAKHGTVCPKIEQRACLQRFTSLDISREQKEAVDRCFKFIVKQLYPRFKFD